MTNEDLRQLIRNFDSVTDAKRAWQFVHNVTPEYEDEFQVALRDGLLETETIADGIELVHITAAGRKLLATKDPPSKPKASLDVRALALFIESTKSGTPLNKKQLAEKLGCHEKSLTPSRCEMLNKMMGIYKARPTEGRSIVRRDPKSKYDDGNFD